MARLSTVINEASAQPRFLAYVGLILVVAAAVSVHLWRQKPKLPDAPFIGYSKLPGKAGMAADVEQYVKNASVLMDYGWKKFSKKGLNYLLQTPTEVIFCLNPGHTEEIRSAAENKLSAIAANCEIMQFRHTLHPLIEKDQYHNAIVQKQLTQSLGPSLHMVVSEAKKAFPAELGIFKEPTDVAMWDPTFRLVTRTANRLLFGEELAGNAEFLRLSVDFSFIMFGGADIIRTYPEYMKPLMMWWKTPMAVTMKKMQNILGPQIRDRMVAIRAHEAAGTMSEWTREKPDDAIQWLLDITTEKDMNLDMLVCRMLHINVAAVHTSSVTFMDCIYELAAHPEIHEELRDEIHTVFSNEDGWRKQGLTKLIKMDSFMRETVRFNPLFSSNLDRIAKVDYTLNDGTFIPKGTYCTVPSLPMYMDEDYYENARTFDAFRFARKRRLEGQETNHSFVQTSPTYLHFGHGKHACPGRFFASNEIKILLVLALMNYDIGLSNGTKEKPAPVWFTKGRSPNPNGVITWTSRTDAPEWAQMAEP